MTDPEGGNRTSHRAHVQQTLTSVIRTTVIDACGSGFVTAIATLDEGTEALVLGDGAHLRLSRPWGATPRTAQPS